MFNKKNEIENKWRIGSSPFKVSFHIAEKEVGIHCKLQKVKREYIKEREKRREYLNGEITRLDRLLKEGSIDEDMYPRLKKLLEIGYEQKRRETREMYGFVNKLVAEKTANEV
jgi:hypothetical protein